MQKTFKSDRNMNPQIIAIGIKTVHFMNYNQYSTS